MTLQEQIAQKLTDLGACPLSDIAAEVERWMEWARRECADKVPDDEAREAWAKDHPALAKLGYKSTAMRYTSLTMPLEDWKP